MKARVLVRLKDGILDVQGATVQRALGGLGFPEVRAVRVGKVVEVEVDGDSAETTRRRVEEMCAKLLANPVTEDFTVEVLAPAPAGAGDTAVRAGAPLARSRPAG